MSTDFRLVFLSFIVALLLVVGVLSVLLPNQSSDITYTEYDIISIDMERFTYIDSNNKIRGVMWYDKPQFVDVYPSNRTYRVIETGANAYYRKYNLYLNVNDLE